MDLPLRLHGIINIFSFDNEINLRSLSAFVIRITSFPILFKPAISDKQILLLPQTDLILGTKIAIFI
jgi:hypothetical protein